MLQDIGIASGQIHAEPIPNTEIVNRLSSGDMPRYSLEQVLIRRRSQRSRAGVI